MPDDTKHCPACGYELTPAPAAQPAMPEPLRYVLCTKCYSAETTDSTEQHAQCPKCGYMGSVMQDDKLTREQAQAYATALAAQQCAELSDKFEAAKRVGIQQEELIMAMEARCAQMVEALEKAEKDAARYRWLRDVSTPPHNFYISVPVEFDGVRYAPEEVDAAIDAALAAGKVGDSVGLGPLSGLS